MKFTRLSSEVKSQTYPVLKEYTGSDFRLVVLFVAHDAGVLIEFEKVSNCPDYLDFDYWDFDNTGKFRSDWSEFKFRPIAGLLEFTGNE